MPARCGSHVDRPSCLLGSLRQRGHVDVLHIAHLLCSNRNTCLRRVLRKRPALPAQIGLRQALLQHGAGGVFDAAHRLPHAPEAGEVVNPAQQVDHDQGNHGNRDDEQHHAPTFAIGTKAQHDHAHHAEDE